MDTLLYLQIALAGRGPCLATLSCIPLVAVIVWPDRVLDKLFSRTERDWTALHLVLLLLCSAALLTVWTTLLLEWKARRFHWWIPLFLTGAFVFFRLVVRWAKWMADAKDDD